MTRTVNRVGLDVALRGDIADSAAPLADATRYLDELCADLGLPVTATIAFEPAAGPPRLRIGDRRASLVPAGGDGAGGTLERLTLTLMRNRELLVTDAVADAVRASFGLPHDWGPSLADLLRECVRLGRSVDRLRDAIKDRPPAERDAVLEAMLASVDAPRLVIAVAGGPETSAVDRADSAAACADRAFDELGALVGVAVEVDASLAPGEYRLRLNDLRAPDQHGLAADTLLAIAPVEHLRLLGITARRAAHPASGADASIVPAAERAQCEAAGLTLLDPGAYPAEAGFGELLRSAGAFLTSEIVEFLLNRLREIAPHLVGEAEARWGVLRLTRVLRRLLEEQLAIRDLRTILEALLRVDGVTTARTGERIVLAPNTGIRFPVRDGRSVDALRSAELAECVRIAMSRYISHRYTRGQNRLLVYVLDPAIEQRIARADEDPLTLVEQYEILAAVARQVGELRHSPGNPVLLTMVEIRHTVRRLIEHEAPDLDVLSYNELLPDVNIQPLARISLG